MLAGEERVEEREPEPEIAGDTGEVDLGVEVAWELAVRIEAEPPSRALTERGRERGLAAVDLRAVPPVRVGRHPRRCAAVRVGEGVIPSPLDSHRPLGPRVVVGELELERLLGQVLAVAEPVVHLELSQAPARTLTMVAGLNSSRGEQLAADEAWIRVEQPGAVSACVLASGTFRPKRAPIIPIAGDSRSL